MELEHINPVNICPAPGYSHVVKAGNTVYIAGQVGRKPDGSLAGLDVESQTDQIFKNLIAALESVGGGLENLVKTMVYVTDATHLAGFKKVRDKYLTGNLPAQTGVIVKLGTPEFKIEIEAIAFIP
ncbi:MAG: enamine deaminase RidA [Chloroflexi bacterium]|nr:enamine deaminase RidA [Chloroflexota bacterium]|tara:strand:+ start:3521 stop:3898 length:378 start_codon:yes stop_codon:yes gene_type:complete